MQNRYVPDLGDYSKFGVMEALCRPGRSDAYPTALIWCLNEPADAAEHAKNDGKHRTYLKLSNRARDRYRDCAPAIYDKLADIESDGDHRVAAYRERALFKRSVRYFEDLIDDKSLGKQERIKHRRAWLDAAARFAEKSEVVVLDPDNGLATDSFQPGSRTAGKYITAEECSVLHDYGRRSLIVYQHAHRGGAFTHQIESALVRLSEAVGCDREACFALRFRRGTARAYLVVPSDTHGDSLRERAEVMLAGPWGREGHFDTVLY